MHIWHSRAVVVALFFSTFSLALAQTTEKPLGNKVYGTIAPIQSLAQSVVGDLGDVQLLVEQNQSVHGYQLKPSQRKALLDAEAIFMIDENLEVFMHTLEKNLAESTHIYSLGEAEDIAHLPTRDSGVWAHAEHADHEEHEHEHEHEHEASGETEHHEHEAETAHDDHAAHEHGDHAEAGDDGHEGHEGHNHGDVDLHIWLDPHNAQAMVHQIEHSLAAQYPEHAEVFAQNAAETIESLQTLDKDIESQLAEVEGAYLVFHDAYQYFEQRYGLEGAGTITLNPEIPPTAKQIAALQARMDAGDVVCVFKEPQFRGKLIDTITRGTTVKVAELDPLGADIPVGASHYAQLLRSMGDTFADCLSTK